MKTFWETMRLLSWESWLTYKGQISLVQKARVLDCNRWTDELTLILLTCTADGIGTWIESVLWLALLVCAILVGCVFTYCGMSLLPAYELEFRSCLLLWLFSKRNLSVSYHALGSSESIALTCWSQDWYVLLASLLCLLVGSCLVYKQRV
jgi:hypothetical protein